MPFTAETLREAVALPSPDKALHTIIDVSGAKPAAVLVPVLFDPEPSVLLVLRGADLRDHAGEVGFPGGKPEPTDADLYATALREAHEEVAVGAEHVERVGELSPVPVITGRYLIHPFVGIVSGDVAPRPASSEIARVLRLPIGPLLSGEQRFSAVVGEWRGAEVFSPYFDVNDVTRTETEANIVLYGASAYIFYELLAKIASRLGRELPPARIASELPWGSRYAKK
jgi:8-oxo-dGTP pyrophosphatase MutT (NUDIX family)